MRLFVGDKANTVFATLFGLGFYIQMYSRRVGVEHDFGRWRPGRRDLALRFGWLIPSSCGSAYPPSLRAG